MRRVPSWGNPNARFILVGEAPGQQESDKGEPFVGGSGWRLGEWWKYAGLQRSDFYIMNVVEYQPPHNNIDAFDTKYLQDWMHHLNERLAVLTDPYVIVPCGNYALYALTGRGKVKWHTMDGKSPRAGITDWRGSILSYKMLDGRVVKVIPTIHPAATFRQPEYEQVCIRDWIKIAHEGTFKELNLPVREHVIRPTVKQVQDYFYSLEEDAHVAVDIENPKIDTSTDRVTAPIVCVGFSHTPEYSITVPTTKAYWGSDLALGSIWQLISVFLNRHPASKIFHNGLYDTFHLAWERDCRVAHYTYDTLYMSHCLDPSSRHALDICASRETRQPFWKHAFRDPDTIAQQYKYNQEDAFWTYNGIDAAVTRELYGVYRERLTSQGRLDFYLKHYGNLLQPLQDLQLHGIRVDATKRQYRLAHLLADCIDIQDRLEAMTGLKLYGKSSLSNDKVKHYLYEVLGLPVQERQRKGKGEKSSSADELAVRKLMLKYPGKLQATGDLILEHKRKGKLREFYAEDRVDNDGRFRSSYSMNTEAGRLSSSSNPNGGGSNAQNIDREIRDMFLPDEGYIGVEVDLSQAEARIGYALIYMLTGAKDMYDKAMMRPDEYDQHTENASYIFNVPTDQVSKDQRYLGKKAVHGSMRSMQGQKLSDELLKDGYVYDAKTCQGMIDAYTNRTAGLQEFFRWVRRRMIEDRYLQNSWGRRLYFTYDRFSDETYRRGYSYDMQSSCADTMNQYGLVPFHTYITDLNSREGQVAKINVHAHDALFYSVRPEYAYQVTEFLVKSLEQEHDEWGVKLRIPCELAIGTSWKGDMKFKRLPDAQTFNAAVHEVYGQAS